MSAAADEVIERIPALVRDLVSRARERARAEEIACADLAARNEAADRALRIGTADASARWATAREAAHRSWEESRAAAKASYEAERDAARAEFVAARQALRDHYADAREAAQTALQEARWTASALLEAGKTEAEAYLRDQQKRVGEKQAKLDSLRQEARRLLHDWKQPGDYLDWTAYDAADARARLGPGKLPQCLVEAEELLEDLKYLSLPRYLRLRRLSFVLVFAWLALIYPLGRLTLRVLVQPPETMATLTAGAAVSAVAALVGGALAYLILKRVAAGQIRRVAQPLGVSFHAAEARVRHLIASLSARCARQVRASQFRHDRTVRRARRRYGETRTAIIRTRRQAFPAVRAHYVKRRSAAAARRDEEYRLADENHAARRETIQVQYDSQRAQLNDVQVRVRDNAAADHRRSEMAYKAAWHETLEELHSGLSVVHAASDNWCPPWDSGHWTDWRPPSALPGALRFGTVSVRRELVPEAANLDEKKPEEALPNFALPALTPYPEGASMLWRAYGAGRGRAVTAIQGMMFRLLTSVPPGRVRFTILDPVGLGQNFAGFMHLADYDPALVAGRIWTEPGQIEQRLADLTTHMETVIQKYLRDRFPTLADYNAKAEEVAEPYRILVIANFPAGFGDEAARRLVRVASAGPRCGVHVLLSVDEDLPSPNGFDLKDLKTAVELAWNGERFCWNVPELGAFPFDIEGPPPAALAERLLTRAGEAAKRAKRVEVPFDWIAPPPDQWWTGDSGGGLHVALGRAGAGGRQYLDLGKGTAQHVLVAGKTGSGKSTLLHALITNVALLYGPDEVELYLVDFKKGVEFKTYAAHALPHARVVAIESEREFGLSVLQRLDAELRHRGEWFRAAGAQDLPTYRAALAADRMETERRRSLPGLPRVLLVVDEFQEFFVEDDRLAQEAAGLLDRLVRQGRAFGLHVLLGSQTLGGAFSLARSTLDQMAVRIALQCSEADAQLILSMDNSAAKLLARPGEAIYNDANGLVEGNHLFQVVWLDEARREGYLTQLRERANGRTSEPPVVFEGNAPADVRRNASLSALLKNGFPSNGSERRAWFGESMALGDPAVAVFRPQSGSNLMLIGQQDDAALGMIVTALVGLSLQPPVSLVVIDGSQANAPETGVLARLVTVLPCPVRLGGWRQIPEILGDLGAEVGSRRENADGAPPVFLFIVGLHRCRDLRRAEDDYGFGRRTEETIVAPAQRLADLLRDGPPAGVHVVAWCDTLNNLQRTLDRQGLREVGLRVVMQMSVSDSSSLIDSPNASRLGTNRALLASEEDGKVEKFRPYGVPPDDWLASIQRLRQHSP